MIRRPPRSTHCISSAASDVYKRQVLNNKEFVTIGGYSDTFKHLNDCDKYNIDSDSWENLPSLNEKKQSMAACLFQGREIYVIGGFNGSRLATIERLTVNPLAKEWVTVDVPNGDEIVPFSCGVAAQVSANEILILRGNKTTDTYKYDIPNNIVRKGEDLKARDSFVLQTMYPIEGSLTVFGYFGSVHVFNIRAQTWDDSEIVDENS
eukprot:TRINITY_DN8134_c0_g1_i17.p1 TRINITY_DN8134_c0_g1~~TRINITY_DN8134_c0_g1_i17.p1  ORF type:complete len:215 (+),score=87.06 TRINITY_DN8134_c0_g1_i17:25-645(+)